MSNASATSLSCSRAISNGFSRRCETGACVAATLSPFFDAAGEYTPAYLIVNVTAARLARPWRLGTAVTRRRYVPGLERVPCRRSAGEPERVAAGQQVAQRRERAEIVPVRVEQLEAEQRERLDRVAPALHGELARTEREERRPRVRRRERRVRELQRAEHGVGRLRERHGPREMQRSAGDRRDDDASLGRRTSRSGARHGRRDAHASRLAVVSRKREGNAWKLDRRCALHVRDRADADEDRTRRDVADEHRLECFQPAPDALPSASDVGSTETSRPRRARARRGRRPGSRRVPREPARARHENAAQIGRVQLGPRLRENGRGSGHGGGGRARPVHGPVARRASRIRGRLRSSRRSLRARRRPASRGRRTPGRSTRTPRPSATPRSSRCARARARARYRSPPRSLRATSPRQRTRPRRREPVHPRRARRCRRAGEARREARAVAPARAALRAVSPGACPSGTSAARPATRLRPRFVKYDSTRANDTPSARARERRAGTSSIADGRTPVSGSVRSSTTCSPLRSDTWTSSVSARVSAAPTVNAPAEPPGPETLPKAGPAGPSFPAGATTSVSRPSAPSTARAAGSSANAAYGAVTPISATRAASCASPSAFGSTARSRPAIS